MSVEIPAGAVETRPAGEFDYIDLAVEGVRVRLESMDLAPHSAESLVRENGGEVVRRERDAEHSAVVARGTDRSSKMGAFEVGGWAPGFFCRAVGVPEDSVDAVFGVCSSMRRHGGILTHAVVPKVHEKKVLRMDAKTISTSQYFIQRIELGKPGCDELLQESQAGAREGTVELELAPNGHVKTWEVDAPDGQQAVEVQGLAERGGFCCYFETYPWLTKIPEADVSALVGLCDNAAEPGWPEMFLPEPFSH